MTTLCDLANKLPNLIGALLESEGVLKRGRFREETLTDLFTGSLAAFAGPDLVIQYPPEAMTGGDLDLDFWHVLTGDWFGLRIQAKRLNAGFDNGRSVKPEHRQYKELLHVVPSTGVHQFKTLMKSSRAEGRLPLYMFYNHAAITFHSTCAGTLPTVRGVNLAFACDVAEKMKAQIAARPKRLFNQRLTNLRPYFFDLATILCPRNSLGAVPTPQEVRSALWEQAGSNLNVLTPQQIAQRVAYRVRYSRRHARLHAASKLISDGPAFRCNPELQRPKVTVISGQTTDERTPFISGEPHFG